MAKTIMIQGTMSNAGKSLITAGLCRIFKEDGYRTAPFKSQNMALNSFVTAEGLEMGRAQVVQAEAAGIEADVRMNPILLKPVSNQGSQVIVRGLARGTYKAEEYYAFKKTLVPEIVASFNSLAAEYDVIVLEGAGSPAEINLKKDDFVNMGMAKIAKAPVLLVGDIDRGGVFAQLCGTLQLLEVEERQRVKALLINKFRGDLNLLLPGLEMLKDLSGKPIAGVVPMLKVDIEEEDSLAARLYRPGGEAQIEIAVPGLPHISNFTDFAALELLPGVRVSYITRVEELGKPNLIVIPGTKNTIEDLLWLRQSGLEGAIKAKAGQGTAIVGICGGYQILGDTITDPSGVEAGGTVHGFGLLPIDTEFGVEKQLSRKTAVLLESGAESFFNAFSGVPVEGYEIHMGLTRLKEGAQAWLRFADGTLDGCIQGNVCGSYLHGLFDSAAWRKVLLQSLGYRSETEALIKDYKTYKEEQYQVLAANLRQALDMDLIYRILEEGEDYGI